METDYLMYFFLRDIIRQDYPTTSNTTHLCINGRIYDKIKIYRKMSELTNKLLQDFEVKKPSRDEKF